MPRATDWGRCRVSGEPTHDERGEHQQPPVPDLLESSQNIHCSGQRRKAWDFGLCQGLWTRAVAGAARSQRELDDSTSR